MDQTLRYILLQNDAVRNIIRSQQTSFVNVLGNTSLQLLLEDMTNAPIGVGRGSYYIDEGFIRTVKIILRLLRININLCTHNI